MPPSPSRDQLIYDWNSVGPRTEKPGVSKIEFDDETLRDGLQSPSVVNPPIDEKIKILHLAEAIGVDTCDIGLPGAGPHVARDVEVLAREIVRAKMKLTPNCAARTVEADIAPIADISQKVGIPIEACVFIGSSPIRQYAEDWTLDRMLEHTRTAVTFAVRHNLPVMYVTEDTTRAHPDTVKALYSAAIDCGAKRLCVCDTCGHATPAGVWNLVSFVADLARTRGDKATVDWHGHNDRGLSVINSMTALQAGACRVHGTILGIGERVGNCPLDQLMINCKLLGWIPNDLHKLSDYCDIVSKACHVPVPNQYPVFGKDAFETGTGVHAAAIIKAFQKGDRWLADRVYSGVPAGDFGREQRIRIGPVSGKSNVIYWLKQHQIEPTDELVAKIFQHAKKSDRLLEDEEIMALTKT